MMNGSPEREGRVPIEKIPDVEFLANTGTGHTRHEDDLQGSQEKNKLDPDRPPVPKNLQRSIWSIASDELLAAKTPCFLGSAAKLPPTSRSQVIPPSQLRRTTKAPFTGSPMTVQICLRAQFTASQNPSFSGFVNSSFQLEHPSTVLYSRDASPGPLAITIAVLSSHAQMPRKSSFSAPGGIAHDCHSYPPSSVRKT